MPQIYGASVYDFLDGYLPCIATDVRGDISIYFSCDPKIASKLVGVLKFHILPTSLWIFISKRPTISNIFLCNNFEQVDLALDEILRLQEEGPSDQDVSTILEIEQRAHENGLQVKYLYILLCV